MWCLARLPRIWAHSIFRAVLRDNSDPFGNNIPNENPNGAGQFSFNLRFAGQYFDKETGLHYNRFRDYNPAIGGYIESDPIGLAGGINTFGYANQNPLSYNDPLGLCGWCLPAAGVAAACYAVYKFFDSSNDALKSADQRQKMQNEMQDWIRDGMKGNPPYTEAQMQQADQQVIQDASKATTEGAKVTTQPLRTTGSLIKYFSK